MELFTKVADLLASHLGVDASTITPESDIVKDLGADSLDVVQLLMELEDNLVSSFLKTTPLTLKLLAISLNLSVNNRKCSLYGEHFFCKFSIVVCVKILTLNFHLFLIKYIIKSFNKG